MSLISYLVFHHSLRIRLKGDVSSDTEKKSGSDEMSREVSVVSAITDEESEHGDDAEPESVANDEEPSDTSDPTPEYGHAKEKTSALVGKINNLLTTDLLTIEHSYRILEIRSSISPKFLADPPTHLFTNSIYDTTDFYLCRYSVFVTRLEVSTLRTGSCSKDTS